MSGAPTRSVNMTLCRLFCYLQLRPGNTTVQFVVTGFLSLVYELRVKPLTWFIGRLLCLVDRSP